LESKKKKKIEGVGLKLKKKDMVHLTGTIYVPEIRRRKKNNGDEKKED